MIPQRQWVESPATNASFGAIIENDSAYNSSPWNFMAACSAYTRSYALDQKTVIAVPFEYYDNKYNTEEAFKDWAKQIEELGGNVTYIGIDKWKGEMHSLVGSIVDHHNRIMWNHTNNRKKAPTAVFMKEDKWVYWEIKGTERNLNYYTFCLLRYLNSHHYQRIVDVYYDIIHTTAIPKVDAIQLAHYFGPNYGYHPYYALFDGRLDNKIKKFRTLADIRNIGAEMIRNICSQNAFFSCNKKTPSRDFTQLIDEYKYEKVYEQFINW